jgi:hypothetical protein
MNAPSKFRTALEKHFGRALGFLFFIALPMTLLVIGKSPSLEATILLLSPTFFLFAWLLARAVKRREDRPLLLQMISATVFFVISFTLVMKLIH